MAGDWVADNGEACDGLESVLTRFENEKKVIAVANLSHIARFLTSTLPSIFFGTSTHQ